MGVCLGTPKYPTYDASTLRRISFQHWPPYLTQFPDEMASAGFFFTGPEDQCRCFYCGGGLRSWEPGEQPWFEHARWFPKCVFVRKYKGKQFINDAQRNNDPQTERVKKNVPYPERQSHDFTNIPVHVVHEMKECRYDKTLIKETYYTLQQSGKSDITSPTLYETISDIKESKVSQPEAEDLTKPVMVTQVDKAKADQELELSIKSLKEENQNLKDHQTCKICLDEPIEIVFQPCSHLAACVSCAPALRRYPICRETIQRGVKAIIC